MAALLARLHGTNHLLRGNNNPEVTSAPPGWASVGDYAEIEVKDCLLVLGPAAAIGKLEMPRERRDMGRRD